MTVFYQAMYFVKEYGKLLHFVYNYDLSRVLKSDFLQSTRLRCKTKEEVTAQKINIGDIRKELLLYERCLASSTGAKEKVGLLCKEL